MNREELQHRLRRLEERKKGEMKRHETAISMIQERQQDALHELEKRKMEQMREMADARREVDSVMRRDCREEKVRYKVECMEIENERQALFADYKAQDSDNDN